MKTRLTLLALLCSSLASADIIYSFTGGGAFNGTNLTYGFRFTPVVDITVSSLGFFDRDANGLSGSHRVGIWDLSQNLLLSTTVTTLNSTLGGSTVTIPGGPVGRFRFTPVPATQLTAGTTYVIGGADEGSADNWFGSVTNQALAPSLATVTSGGFASTSTGFLYPGSGIVNGTGWGIVSFEANATVPEPGTTALLGVGLALGSAVLRRRVRRNV